MNRRYEIKDSRFPNDRGVRYTSLERARRELSWTVPPGRFYIWDLETETKVK